MLLTLKNTILTSLRMMTAQCERDEGVPDRFELTPKEAATLIWEVNRLHVEKVKVKDTSSSILKWKNPLECISFEKAGSTDVVSISSKLVLFGKTKPSVEQVRELLKQWYAGEYIVTYKSETFHVPLVIKVPPKKEKPETAQPTGKPKVTVSN